MEPAQSPSDDLVAFWEVPLQDKVHRIEFEHGTTSGKRVIRIDGKEILRRPWMFKLVGDESFSLGAARCVIRVEPVGGFAYGYALEVNGKSYRQFTETQTKALRTWIVHVNNQRFRVVLEKETLDIWANGEKLDVEAEFVDGGTETHFSLGGADACIQATSTGRRRDGVVYTMMVQGRHIPLETNPI